MRPQPRAVRQVADRRCGVAGGHGGTRRPPRRTRAALISLISSMVSALLLLVAPAAQAAGRVALVVGNSAYEHVGRLPNPENDATDLDAALRGLGFEVTVVRDADRTALTGALRAFTRRSAGADVALVFYAGHGMEMDGVNYLLPVNARLERDTDVRFETVTLDDMLASTAGAGLRLVILDACRNNPLARSMQRTVRSRNVSNGSFGAVNEDLLGDQTLVAYSAAAGTTADDGDGRNSPYAAALLAHLEDPVEIGILFRRVRARVLSATSGRQRPHEYGALVGEHYLSGSEGGGVAARPTPAGAGGRPVAVAGGLPDPVRAQQETVFWQSAANSTNAADFEAYLARWPNGVYASLARNRLAALRAPTPNPSATARPDPDPVPTHADGDEFRDCPSCPKMVAIPAGTFRMGSGPDDDEALDRERPRHRVRVGRFALGRYEVTRREYRAFAEATGADDSWRDPGFAQDDRHPVVNVSWRDARAYVQWLSRETGERYRLPSEAEWEYAARGGTTTRRHWGDSSSSQCGYANGTVASCDDGVERTAPVGSYAPNAFGLSDVLGNVWEWTDDCWHEDYAGEPPDDGRAWTRAGDCGRRVLRGGSWYNLPRSLRSAARPWNLAGTRDAFTGFRVARTLDR